MALTKDIKTDRYGTPDEGGGMLDDQPMGASAKVYAGSVMILRGGYVVAASSPLSTDKVIGIVRQQVTEITGVAGGTNATGDAGMFWLASGTSSDYISQANVESVCYLLDEQTVALTSNSNARPPAGIVKAFDSITSKVAVQLLTNY
jgi:hypothetical protein